MTALKKRLIGLIGANGPISVSDYFAACLFDPDHGYYTTREPFGRGGDFTTAPEVSQLFGEMLAVWAWQNWQAIGAPDRFSFAEIGPGRGTLMADLARALSRIGGGAFLQAAQVFMIEASPRLAGVQRETLAGLPVEPRWLATVGELPALPIVIVGNELFDAVPLRQYVKAGGAWRERMVALDQAGGDLAFAIGTGTADPASLPPGAGNRPDGTIVEIALARTALMDEIATRIAAHGGAGLFVDYGSLGHGFGDTLQAVKGHEYDPVLANPGAADLTSHVDFEALAKTARDAGLATRSAAQGEFLLALGLLERAGLLGAGKDAAMQERIRGEVERLAGPGQMGELFKVLAIGEPDAPWMP